MTAELIFIGMDLLEDEVAKRGSAFLIEKCRKPELFFERS